MDAVWGCIKILKAQLALPLPLAATLSPVHWVITYHLAVALSQSHLRRCFPGGVTVGYFASRVSCSSFPAPAVPPLAPAGKPLANTPLALPESCAIPFPVPLVSSVTRTPMMPPPAYDAYDATPGLGRCFT